MPAKSNHSSALSYKQPVDAGSRLLLFGIRQMGTHGLHDACAAHAFLTAFGRGFQRPLILLRAFMQEVSATAAGPIPIAPWCCNRMTASEAGLLQSIARTQTNPENAALVLADVLGVRDATGILVTAHALANAFGDMGVSIKEHVRD